MKLSTTKIFPKLQGGTRQRGGTGQRRIRYIKNCKVNSDKIQTYRIQKYKIIARNLVISQQ